MVHIAIRVRELVSSNVSSAIDSASNPAKMLAHLQREIEEALIGLHGDIAKARRQQERKQADLDKAGWTESDWSDKAQVAMDHGREDLARQALMAREDCRSSIAAMKKDVEALEAGIAEMEEAERELEAKREDVRQRLADQRASDGKSGPAAPANRTERRLDHIDALEKRTTFATAEAANDCANASVEREIEAMRREREIEEELAAMRTGKAAAKPAKKAGKRKKTV
ncbi:PspA/IM30 family protein [Qipengyuania sp. 1NDH17]|uniref:PspA/IM30 family protein n=1 Tax=Qipengyuania polymorpha TaxID=2867234 RepID=A0ABS7IXQ9_9SPHN|nr:PspA/IM30 family protein [Qipengyuania polymorpha]MBX7458173.1 PspA/IM30 family protein [Qipengyuania polymorpha]